MPVRQIALFAAILVLSACHASSTSPPTTKIIDSDQNLELAKVVCKTSATEAVQTDVDCEPEIRTWLGRTWLSDVLMDADGFYYAIGTKGSELFVAKTDADLNLIKSYTPPTTKIGNGNALYLNKDKDVFLCGTVYEPNLVYPSIYVARLNSEFELEWEDYPDLGSCNDIYVTPDNEIVAVGDIRKGPWGGLSAWMAKFGADGEILFSKSFDGNGKVFGIKPLGNGHLLTFGIDSSDEIDGIDMIWREMNAAMDTLKSDRVNKSLDGEFIREVFVSGSDIALEFNADHAFHLGNTQYLAITKPFLDDLGPVSVSARDFSGEDYWVKRTGNCSGVQSFHASFAAPDEILIICGSQFQKFQIQ